MHRRQIRSACCGANLAGFVTKPVGWLRFAVAPELMLRPQRPQKRENSGSMFEQRGHGNERGDSPGLTRTKFRLPHRPQNFTPSANRELQFEQATMPGIRLECTPLLLLPCDGEGLLPASVIDLSCACMTCSSASSRISITRSSSRSPAFETRRICCPAGISVKTTRPELPTLPFRSSSM